MSRRDDLIRVQQDIFDTFGVDKEEEFETPQYDNYILCGACQGTGLNNGSYVGSSCPICNGKGDLASKQPERDWGD